MALPCLFDSSSQRRLSVFGLAVTGALLFVSGGLAQNSPTSLGARPETLPSAPSSVQRGKGSDDGDLSLLGFPKRVLVDEFHIVTSPAHLRKADLVWLLPLAGASAAAFATDTKTNRDVVSHTAATNDAAGTTSDALRDGFIGVPVLLFAVGELTKQEHPREAGLLGGEAILDAYAFGAAVKLITLRERPLTDDAQGKFFQRSAGWDSSFPSGHTMVAWSSAAVMAGEYHRPWQQITAYTLASGVSLTRVLAEQHFPSDVLIGSAAGWLIGHYVFRAHSKGARSH